MFSQLFPIVATTDMARALGFYRDQLGGTVTFEYPGPEGFPVYVAMEIGASHFAVGLDPDLKSAPLPRAVSLWVYTDDCDGAVEQLGMAGVPVTEEPTDQPWGERTARVLDPDGNAVIIGQREAP